eukprot:TRINITY_DN556_c0_g1_i2.p1 TRINITY_DN556_c0_g1~~TRINITY_DN556_c0_g1_i2.p1  ORF type:complete len:517 (+),score=119.36 TRINITY_DN556_c0_g1_i2:32-1582(+)
MESKKARKRKSVPVSIVPPNAEQPAKKRKTQPNAQPQPKPQAKPTVTEKGNNKVQGKGKGKAQGQPPAQAQDKGNAKGTVPPAKGAAGGASGKQAKRSSHKGPRREPFHKKDDKEAPQKDLPHKKPAEKDPAKNEIQEGKVTIKAGEANPGVLGFYNPQMRFNRDLSVLLLSLKSHPHWKVLDCHSSTGVLAMRWAKEISKPLNITANDLDPQVFQILKQNISDAKLDNKIRAAMEDANVLLHQDQYDYVHLDPYGTSAVYLDAAFKSLRNGGILTITTTDLTGICGTFPNVALRNYGGVTSEKVPFKRELGARVVLAAAARSAARHGKGIEPLYTFMRARDTHSFNTEHYLCMAIRVQNGTKPADAALLKIKRIFVGTDGEVSFDKPGGSAGEGMELGPAWCGPLGDSDLIKSFVGMIKTNDHFDQSNSFISFLASMKTELLFSDLIFYHKINKIVGKDVTMPVERVIALLKDKGHVACKTHWDNNAVKTNASLAQTKQIIFDHLKDIKQPFLAK